MGLSTQTWVQGDHSTCAKPPVDFKTKVPLARAGQATAELLSWRFCTSGMVTHSPCTWPNNIILLSTFARKEQNVFNIRLKWWSFLLLRGITQPTTLLNSHKTKPNPRILFQRWDEREKHLAKFLRDLTGQFRQIRTTDGFATNRSMQVCMEPQCLSHRVWTMKELIWNYILRRKHVKKVWYTFFVEIPRRPGCWALLQLLCCSSTSRGTLRRSKLNFIDKLQPQSVNSGKIILL